MHATKTFRRRSATICRGTRRKYSAMPSTMPGRPTVNRRALKKSHIGSLGRRSKSAIRNWVRSGCHAKRHCCLVETTSPLHTPPDPRCRTISRPSPRSRGHEPRLWAQGYGLRVTGSRLRAGLRLQQPALIRRRSTHCDRFGKWYLCQPPDAPWSDALAKLLQPKIVARSGGWEDLPAWAEPTQGTMAVLQLELDLRKSLIAPALVAAVELSSKLLDGNGTCLSRSPGQGFRPGRRRSAGVAGAVEPAAPRAVAAKRSGGG